MNVNFGLFPPLRRRRVRGKRPQAGARRRALADLDAWLAPAPLAAE